MLRNKNKLILVVSVLLLVMFLVTACGESDRENGEPVTDDTPRYGGVLRLAYGSNPPHFDFHMGTMGQPGADIGSQMLEPLYELDSGLVPQPMLAESHELSEDMLTYHIKLREGVKFHNGKEMTAEDVVASLERALHNLPSPPELKLFYESIEVKDKYTVTIRLHTATGDFFWFLATPVFAVMPKEVCEEYWDKQMSHTAVIGTGPYVIKAFEHDRFVHLVKFDEYSPVEAEPDGWSGKKHAYVDEILFDILPDQSVRLMGLEKGDYHYAQAIQYGDYQFVEDHPRMRPIVTMPSAIFRTIVNNKYAPTSDVTIRQAAQAATNAAEILDAAYYFDILYRLDSGWMAQESKWHTTAGSQYYNQNDPDRAKALLKEAGYNQEEVVVLGINESEFLRTAAMVFGEQLVRAGFNVRLELHDTGTYIHMFLQQEGWNFAVVMDPGEAAVGTPTSLGWTRDPHYGWWEGETPRKKELANMLRKETEFEARYAIWEELHELLHEEAGRILFGTVAYCSAAGMDTEGWWDTTFQNPGGPRFWNIWIRQ